MGSGSLDPFLDVKPNIQTVQKEHYLTMLNLGNKIGCSRTISFKPEQKLSDKVTEIHYQRQKQIGVQVDEVRSLETDRLGKATIGNSWKQPPQVPHFESQANISCGKKD